MDIVKELKGGSLSRTLVVSDGARLLVRKLISRTHNREYGLVRWQSQIRKLQLLNRFLPHSSAFVERVGEHGDYLFYDIPYLDQAINCYQSLLLGESAALIAERIVELLRNMASISYGSVTGSIAVYICEEVLSPLLLASELIDTGRLQLLESEQVLFRDAVHNGISKARRLIDLYRDVSISESLTHGNLTLENILWSPLSKQLTIIDPYAETYCETIIGDVSQLYQSSLSGYEYITELFESVPFTIDEYPCKKIPDPLIRFSEHLARLLEKEEWYSRAHLQLFRASQFTRMFPFKLESRPRHGAAFMMHGINLISSISC